MAKRIQRVEPGKKGIYDFKDEFMLERETSNKSQGTLEYYETHLKTFTSFLESKRVVFLQDVDHKAIFDYRAWLMKEYANATTVNTKLRAVRAFMNYAYALEYIPKRVAVNMVTEPEKIKAIYTKDEIEKLLTAPANLKKCSFVDYRDWVLMNYLFGTGNRLNTVINIKVSDVDLIGGMVILKEVKNKKQMYSPLTPYLVKILREYLRTFGLRSDDYLFPNANRGQFDRNAIQTAVQRYNKGRGVKKTSIHLVRHTFATEFIKGGGDGLQLQRLLGHKTLVMTQRYINLCAEDLKESVKDNSILNRFSSGRIKRVG